LDLPDQIALQKELRSLFDNNPMGVAIMRHEAHADGLVTAHRVYTNHALACLFGAPSVDELIKRPVHESWVDFEALASINHKLKTQQQILNYEAERFRTDGSMFWVSMTSQEIESQGRNLTIVWHIDITDKKRAEQEQKLSERRLWDYMESSVDWAWETDADLRFIYLSENVERITGIKPEWHYGKTRQELLGDDYDHETWDVHLKTLSARELYRDFIYPRLGPNGEKRWISSSGKPVFSEGGEFLGYRGIGSDVTERIENQGLRIANQAKTEFLASMSHELRTPLNAVIGFGQMLEMDRPRTLTADQQEYAQYVVKSGHHLLALISEVLDLAGIESGHLKLSVEPVNADALIIEVLKTIEPVALKSGIRLTHDASDWRPNVQADVQRFRQVLLNLVSNAIKYNKPNGSVTVRLFKHEGRARIEFSDTGLGISEPLWPKIFTPFERLGHESSEIEGAGIGLALSKRLVEAMDGRIGFESSAGVGSTFWIDLALSETAPRTPPDGSADLRLTAGGYSLLYVEDNPSNLRLMEHLVGTQPNVQMYSAPSGGLGLELAKARRPDVIVLDLNLPGMSGFDILKHLKSHPETWNTPVLALTAAAMPNDVKRGLAAGFFRYIAKPLDVNAFLTAIEDALSDSHRGKETAVKTETHNRRATDV